MEDLRGILSGGAWMMGKDGFQSPLALLRFMLVLWGINENWYPESVELRAVTAGTPHLISSLIYLHITGFSPWLSPSYDVRTQTHRNENLLRDEHKDWHYTVIVIRPLFQEHELHLLKTKITIIWLLTMSSLALYPCSLGEVWTAHKAITGPLTIRQ